MNKTIRVVFDDDVSDVYVDAMVGAIQAALQEFDVVAVLFVGEEEQCDGADA